MKEKIYIYYTNDLHSDFTYWPQVVSHFNKARKQRERNDESYFIVDVGDHIDRVHPIAEAFMGKANVELLNEAGYDAITIGNNEGITLAHHELYHLYDNANFEVVCSNLQSQTGSKPNWLKSTIRIESKSGVKIGIIGLTAPFNPFYHLLNWHIEDPYAVLKAIVNDVSKTTDIVILLSHLGFSEDEMIAERFPQIDVIIGGHTHHLLKTGKKMNDTMITAAGKHCSHIGEVILTWDHCKKQLVKNEAYVTNITHLNPDAATVKTLESLEQRAKHKLATPITCIDEPLKVNWFKETRVIKQLTATLLEWTKSDIAMLNAGLLLDDFQSGQITYGDVHRICPHPINPVVVELTGNELKEVVRVSQTEEFQTRKLKGFGFRGEIIGKMIFVGLDIIISEHQTGEKYIKDLYIENQLIIDDHIYSVATADMFMFGRILPEIAKSKRKDLFLPEFIRDLLVHTLRENIYN